jgi:hypothetical protein
MVVAEWKKDPAIAELQALRKISVDRLKAASATEKDEAIARLRDVEDLMRETRIALKKSSGVPQKTASAPSAAIAASNQDPPKGAF